MAFDGSAIIEIWSSDEEPSPLKHGKKKKEQKSRLEDNDCFILDFDPFDLSKKLAIADDNDAQEISIIAERGPVACRDFPHSRHLCVKFPFKQTPHESFCKMCYCYVCDMPAPCIYWSGILPEHCNASDQDPTWQLQRKVFVKLNDHQIPKHGMEIHFVGFCNVTFVTITTHDPVNLFILYAIFLRGLRKRPIGWTSILAKQGDWNMVTYQLL